jgi:hypothetical protein
MNTSRKDDKKWAYERHEVYKRNARRFFCVMQVEEKLFGKYWCRK